MARITKAQAAVFFVKYDGKIYAGEAVDKLKPINESYKVWWTWLGQSPFNLAQSKGLYFGAV